MRDIEKDRSGEYHYTLHPGRSYWLAWVYRMTIIIYRTIRSILKLKLTETHT